MPDHDVLFAQLRQRVREQISPHVVVLRSRDCNTGTHSNPKTKSTRRFTAKWYGMGTLYAGVKATMRAMLTQLLETAKIVSTHSSSP